MRISGRRFYRLDEFGDLAVGGFCLKAGYKGDVVRRRAVEDGALALDVDVRNPFTGAGDAQLGETDEPLRRRRHSSEAVFELGGERFDRSFVRGFGEALKDVHALGVFLHVTVGKGGCAVAVGVGR